MAKVSVSLPADGDTIDAADYNTPITTIVNEFNGNIDSTNIKAGGVIGSNISSGASGVGNANLLTTAGDIGGAWLAWTPTWVGTAGQPSTVARYTQIGKTIKFSITATFGAGDLPNGTYITFTTPTTMAASAVLDCTPILKDANIGEYFGAASVFTSNTIVIQTHIVSGSFIVKSTLSSTAPFTWVATDSIRISGSYETA